MKTHGTRFHVKKTDKDGKFVSTSSSSRDADGGSGGGSKRGRGADGSHAPIEGVDIVSITPQGVKLCEGYNTGHCKSDRCPHRKHHRCNLADGFGKPCNGWHVRVVHHEKALKKRKIVG